MMNKTIAYIVSNPGINDARVIKMAKAAANQGFMVYLFGVVKPGFESYEEIDNITFIRFEWKPINLLIEKSFIMKLIQFISKKFSIYLAKKILPYIKYKLFADLFFDEIVEIKPDFIHSHDLICLPTASKVAEELDIPYIYDAHELEIHRNPPLPIFQKFFVKHIEKKFAKKATYIITVGRYVADELGKHLDRQKIHVLYNSPEIVETRYNIRNDLNIADNKKIIFYVGKVAIGRGIEDIIKLLPTMSNDIVFATVGPVDPKQKIFLEKLSEKQKVSDRFHILPPVLYNQVVDYIKGADVGIISVQPVTLSYQYSMPNKLFELSFANVPIISNELDEIQEFIAEHRNGIVLDINNSIKMKYYIDKILKTKEKYIMDEKIYNSLYNKYSWKVQLEKLFKLYGNL